MSPPTHTAIICCISILFVLFHSHFELFLFSLGYLDRLALLAAFLLILSDALLQTQFHFPPWLLLGVLVLPYLQALSALIRTRATAAWWLRLPYLFLLFPIDLLAAARSTPTQCYTDHAPGTRPDVL